MKKVITGIFKEMIPVILGVLVALFINRWAEDIKDQAYIKEITQSMKLEFDESLEEINSTIPKQNTLIDSLRMNMPNTNMSVMDVARLADGFHIAQIKNNSWKAISQTKIELLEYERLKVLSDIDYGKELLNEKQTIMMNYVFNNINETSETAKQTVMILMSDLINTERALKAAIEEYQALDNDEVN